ncbi:MAG: metal ABC transporter substrate-binding protein [Nitrososphaerales archaeon]
MLDKFKTIYILFTVLFLITISIMGPYVTASPYEKPIIVCTTEVIGSIVRELVEDKAIVVVLVNPSLCPAFYDIKPGDVYSVNNAKLLFYHGIAGEMWLPSLIKTSETKAIQIKVSGDWNTPDGVKRYVINISKSIKDVLGIDVSDKASKIIKDLDNLASEIKEEAKALNVGAIKVVCMEWQLPFIKYLGFNVVASYGIPDRVPASEVVKIVAKAKEEGVALVIDNLQSGIDLGARIAYDVGATHVVLTNFPGAISGTENLVKMLRYNFAQLAKGISEHGKLQSLRSEVGALKNQVLIFQAISIILTIIVIVEGIILYTKRKR